MSIGWHEQHFRICRRPLPVLRLAVASAQKRTGDAVYQDPTDAWFGPAPVAAPSMSGANLDGILARWDFRAPIVAVLKEVNARSTAHRSTEQWLGLVSRINGALPQIRRGMIAAHATQPSPSCSPKPKPATR